MLAEPKLGQANDTHVVDVNHGRFKNKEYTCQKCGQTTEATVNFQKWTGDRMKRQEAIICMDCFLAVLGLVWMAPE